MLPHRDSSCNMASGNTVQRSCGTALDACQICCMHSGSDLPANADHDPVAGDLLNLIHRPVHECRQLFALVIRCALPDTNPIPHGEGKLLRLFLQGLHPGHIAVVIGADHVGNAGDPVDVPVLTLDASHAHTVMQVAAGGSACAALYANGVSDPHRVPGFYQQAGQMPEVVDLLGAGAPDLHILTKALPVIEAVLPTGVQHHPVDGAVDGFAVHPHQIQPIVSDPLIEL